MNAQDVRCGLKGFLKAVLLVVFSVALLVAWSPLVSAAQSTPAAMACSQVVPMVQKNLKEGCAALDRDQICYGNQSIAAEYQNPAETITFSKPGDRAPLKALKSLTVGPLNLDRGEWGLAVLKVQANLPNTTVGQTVTFLVYGDTTLTNATEPAASPSMAVSGPACSAVTTRATYLRGEPGPNAAQVQLLQANTPVNIKGRATNNAWILAESGSNSGWLFIQNLRLNCDPNTLPPINPAVPFVMPGMNAFYFTTGVGAQASCQDIPPSGLMVQSPGGSKVTFRANGVDLTIGSAVVLRAQPNRAFTLSVLQGSATISMGQPLPGAAQPPTAPPVSFPPLTITTGQEVSIPLGGANGLEASGPPSAPRNIPAANDLQAGTLCQIAQAAGLTIPCTAVLPTPTRRPIIATQTRPPASVTPPLLQAPSATPTALQAPSATSTTPRTAPPTLPSPTTEAATSSCTFTVQRFAADQNPVSIDPKTGTGCTTLRWSVTGVESLLLNGQGVALQGSQGVCIQKPTTFTLTMNCGRQSQSSSYTLDVRSPAQQSAD